MIALLIATAICRATAAVMLTAAVLLMRLAGPLPDAPEFEP